MVSLSLLERAKISWSVFRNKKLSAYREKDKAEYIFHQGVNAGLGRVKQVGHYRLTVYLYEEQDEVVTEHDSLGEALAAAKSVSTEKGDYCSLEEIYLPRDMDWILEQKTVENK